MLVAAAAATMSSTSMGSIAQPEATSGSIAITCSHRRTCSPSTTVTDLVVMHNF
jgi:hypothetical protein